MPIYEYACRGCGHEFETIARAGAANPPCPDCDSDVDKKISLSSFQLKGGGWYSDAYGGKDNRKPGTSSAPSKSSESPSKSTSPSASSSDSSSSTSSSSDSSSSTSSKSTSKSSKSSSAA